MIPRILSKTSIAPVAAPVKGATRYFIVRYWVDAVGRKPTWDEVRAVPDNTPVQVGLRAAQTNPERDRGRLVSSLQKAIDELPTDQRKVPALITGILKQEQRL